MSGGDIFDFTVYSYYNSYILCGEGETYARCKHC
jgi:hypothetical protein